MQAAFRESKRKDGTGRTFYRCVVQRSRALPEDFDHPPSVYVRQEPIITQLNNWIATLADPAALAAGQDDDGAAAATAAELRRRIREGEAKLANLVASIEAGIDPTMIAPQMAARTAERNGLQSRLRQLLNAKRASAKQVEDEINFFGGIAPMLAKATPAELLDIYNSMQLKLIYLPASRTVKAQVTAGACENVRVRGGT